MGLKIKQILKRYLEGKSSPVEEQTVDNWYRRLDEETPVKITGAKEDRLREEIWQSIHAAVTPKPTVVKQLNYNWLKAAVAILVFSTIGLLIWQSSYKASFLAKVDASYTVISTKTGERKLVNLSDGTLLTLNSGSSVRINNDFTKRRNVAIIDGEVYFDVKHDTSRPFIIQSGPITTHVLGTAFNVRAYAALNKMMVGVTHGKVGVIIKGKPVQYLVNNRQLIFDKKRSQIILAPLNREVLAWQHGNMVLNDACFEEMAVLIKKNYGLTVTAHEKSVLSSHFTTVLSTSMPAIKALEVIAAIHHFEIKKRRDTIEIYQ